MIKLCKKLIRFLLLIALLFAAGTAGIGYLTYKSAIEKAPIEEKVSQIQEKPGFKTLGQISKDFTDAIVAIEDRRFYEHGAIDPIALVRATIVNFIEGEKQQGGSTLTQQVAKNLYFNHEKTYTRKIAELFAAWDLEKQYSKDEILELYVNLIYYGDGNYGVTEASMNYFGKDPADLSYDEATLLAGLPQAPSAYALSTNYARAKERQEEVIEALESYRN